MNSIDYLNAIRIRYECSDYKAAALIGVGKAQISAIRTGKSGFGEAPALKIAELLHLRPQVVLANLMAEKAPNEEVKGAWLEVVTKFAACVVFFFAIYPAGTVHAVSLHNPYILHPSEIRTGAEQNINMLHAFFRRLVTFFFSLSNISLRGQYE
jgi:hypothetical protein